MAVTERWDSVLHGSVRRMRILKLLQELILYDGIKNDYPVFASLAECTVDADVIIDFSNAKAVDALLDYCVEKQIPVVLVHDRTFRRTACRKSRRAYEKVAILKSANMSSGNQYFDGTCSRKLQQVFAPAGFDMEIVEKHHNQKLDAPSGTALALADSMNEALDDAYTYTTMTEARSARRETNMKSVYLQSVEATLSVSMK